MTKMHFKVSSVKIRQFCLGLVVLNGVTSTVYFTYNIHIKIHLSQHEFSSWHFDWLAAQFTEAIL